MPYAGFTCIYLLSIYIYLEIEKYSERGQILKDPPGNFTRRVSLGCCYAIYIPYKHEPPTQLLFLDQLVLSQPPRLLLACLLACLPLALPLYAPPLTFAALLTLPLLTSAAAACHLRLPLRHGPFGKLGEVRRGRGEKR